MNKKLELEELYKYIYNSELLVIDDLGTETTNAFVCSKLFEVINQRGLTGKSTVISTNLSMKELQERYSERIMSRIIERYTVLQLYGENIRYQKRKKETKAQIRKRTELYLECQTPSDGKKPDDRRGSIQTYPEMQHGFRN